MLRLTKIMRLRQRQDFRRTLDNGRKVVSPLMVLFLASHTQGQAGPRLGVIASRKVGNAVARNYVKRRLRESFRHLRPELESHALFENADLVVIARNTAAQATIHELDMALKQCLGRLERMLARPSQTKDAEQHAPR